MELHPENALVGEPLRRVFIAGIRTTNGRLVRPYRASAGPTLTTPATYQSFARGALPWPSDRREIFIVENTGSA